MVTTIGIDRRGMHTVALALLALSVAGPARAAEVKDITVAVSSTSFVLGGVRIGENAGIFEKNGIHLHVVVMDSGNAAMSALIGGSAQFTVAGPSEVLAAKARGVDVVIVANLYRGLAGPLVLAKAVADKLPVKPDAPVSDRLKALNGLTIAVPSATSALLAPFRTSAEQVGAKVKFTYMAQPAMVAALESGAIQGMIASFPYAGTAILGGKGVQWIDGPGAELPAAALPASSSTVQTTAAYARANADTVRRFQQSIIDIATFIPAHPDAAKQDLAKGYPQLSPAEIDLAFKGQKENWTKPFLTAADMQHELELLRASAPIPGLDTVDPAKLLIPGPH